MILDFEKLQKWPFCKGYSKAKLSQKAHHGAKLQCAKSTWQTTLEEKYSCSIEKKTALKNI